MVKREFPDARLIINGRNVGFAGANNQAIKECIGRYILFMNPDMELIDNSLKSMVEFMDAHQNIDAIGCKLLSSDGSLQTSCRRFPSLFIDLIESLYLDNIFQESGFFNRYRMADWAHDDFREVDQPYGACLLFKQDVFKKVGLMDERFFMYYDEVELCYRIKKNGGSIYFLPQIKMIHHGNKSSIQAGAQIERWKLRSRLLFFQKRYGSYSFWILLVNLIMRSMVVLVIFQLTHLLFGRPRDVGYFKDPLMVIWSEYINFFKSRGG